MLRLCRTIGDRAGKAISLCNLALAIQGVGDYGRAQGYLSAALVIHQATGNRWEEVTIWNNLGGLHQELGDLRQAESCLQRGLELSQEIGDEAGQTYILINLGLVACERGDLAAADRQLADGLAMAKKQDDKRLVSGFLSVMSIASLQAGKLEQSVEQSKAALALHKEMDLRSYTADDLATLAAAYLAVGDLTQALDCTQQSWIILEECGGEGPEFPQRDYFICYQVLSAAGQGERARAALQSAYDLIMARAEKITDPALRRSFLEGVQVNQVIVAAWEENSVTTGRYSGTR